MSGMRMGGMGMGGGPASAAGGAGGRPARPRRQAPPVEHCLNLSLEELYQGSSKRMRITKKVKEKERGVCVRVLYLESGAEQSRVEREREDGGTDVCTGACLSRVALAACRV